MTSGTSAKPQHWSRGLISSLNDPTQVVEKDEVVAVIKDAYPKAKHHLLILPLEDISGIFKLNKSHIGLLQHMEDVAKKHCSTIPNTNFKIGYHSVPSMQRLHLHVISDDMISDKLKNKIHWNSFTTKFFIPSEELIKLLECQGHIVKMSETEHKNLMNTPLKCHKCSFIPKNMPELKKHILSHI